MPISLLKLLVTFLLYLVSLLILLLVTFLFYLVKLLIPRQDLSVWKNLMFTFIALFFIILVFGLESQIVRVDHSRQV